MADEARGNDAGPVVRPDPDNPGWLIWSFGESDHNLFNEQVLGTLRLRREPDGAVRLRLIPEKKHLNPMGMIHGGTILSLIDIAFFTTWRVTTQSKASGAVTLELNNHFIGPGAPSLPLDAVTHVMRETGRLVFLRGEVVQEDRLVSSFTGIVRKASN